ncbi:MAG: hypothetical protein ACAI44_01945, partial [Candidatus Sericytochromatia bacterium]
MAVCEDDRVHDGVTVGLPERVGEPDGLPLLLHDGDALCEGDRVGVALTLPLLEGELVRVRDE